MHSMFCGQMVCRRNLVRRVVAFPMV
jgi:hypothetical protein